jgi:AAHS family 4-hydroxybenzoate transporter-like MFS transporter
VTLVTIMASGFAIGAASAGQIAPLLSQRWGWQGLFAYGGVMPLVVQCLFWGIRDQASRRCRACSVRHD